MICSAPDSCIMLCKCTAYGSLPRVCEIWIQDCRNYHDDGGCSLEKIFESELVAHGKFL